MRKLQREQSRTIGHLGTFCCSTDQIYSIRSIYRGPFRNSNIHIATFEARLWRLEWIVISDFFLELWIQRLCAQQLFIGGYLPYDILSKCPRRFALIRLRFFHDFPLSGRFAEYSDQMLKQHDFGKIIDFELVIEKLNMPEKIWKLSQNRKYFIRLPVS